MLEKLKQWAESVKQVLMYIIGPLAFVIGYIYYLLTKNKDLEERLRMSQAEKQLANTLVKKGMVDENAKNSSQSFNELVSDFDSKYGSGDDPTKK